MLSPRGGAKAYERSDRWREADGPCDGWRTEFGRLRCNDGRPRRSHLTPSANQVGPRIRGLAQGQAHGAGRNMTEGRATVAIA